MKKISYWSAIITHLLTTGFMVIALNVIVGIALGSLINIAPASIIPLIAYIGIPAIFVGVIALATFASTKFLKRYEIENIENVLNFSSIIFALVVVLWQGLNMFGLAFAALGTLAFYFISKKYLKHHKTAHHHAHSA